MGCAYCGAVRKLRLLRVRHSKKWWTDRLSCPREQRVQLQVLGLGGLQSQPSVDLDRFAVLNTVLVCASVQLGVEQVSRLGNREPRGHIRELPRGT